MNLYSLKSIFGSSVAIVVLLMPINYVFPFAYIFASEGNGVDIVTHPPGYTGTGGVLNVSVGINPSSPNASNMEISTQNVIFVFNNLISTTGNLQNGLPSGSIDFESVLLHELGHSLGLAHCNAATESGLTGNNQNYTKAERGSNNTFDLSPGSDGIIGSADDVRGDDINLNYFKISDNNPFTLPNSGIIDASTYSRNLTNLPGSDLFSTNGDRSVSSISGFPPDTESVMQQGTFGFERQRTLAADDVAGIRFAAAGIDETQGTADDYTLVLNYAGLTTNADIVIAFNNSQTGFAVSQSSGTFIGVNHLRVNSTSNIFFNTNSNWFFNNQLLSTDENSLNAFSLKVYPNPATNVLNVRNNNLVEINKINVYNTNGTLVKSSDYNKSDVSNQMQLNLFGLPVGVYVVEILSEEIRTVRHIIKK